jgi:hypothetical protein
MFPVQSVKPMTVPLGFGASRNGPFTSGRWVNRYCPSSNRRFVPYLEMLVSRLGQRMRPPCFFIAPAP